MQNRLKNIVPSLLALLLVFLVLPDSKGFAFRWKHKIVSIGDTKPEILNKCGEPNFQEVVGTEAKGGSFKWTDDGKEDEDLDITRKHYSAIYLKVERWYYDFGSHKFIQILTFRGGILKKIESGDYGGANWDRQPCRNGNRYSGACPS